MAAQLATPPALSISGPALTPEGITFGNRIFSEPRTFPRGYTPLMSVPLEQGLYLILVPDATCGPPPFKLLFVGEARNLQERMTVDHEGYPEWARKTPGQQLYFAYHTTPGMTYEQRHDAELTLIEECHPVINVRIDPQRALRGLSWIRTSPPEEESLRLLYKAAGRRRSEI